MQKVYANPRLLLISRGENFMKRNSSLSWENQDERLQPEGMDQRRRGRRQIFSSTLDGRGRCSQDNGSKTKDIQYQRHITFKQKFPRFLLPSFYNSMERDKATWVTLDWLWNDILKTFYWLYTFSIFVTVSAHEYVACLMYMQITLVLRAGNFECIFKGCVLIEEISRVIRFFLTWAISSWSALTRSISFLK